MQDRVVGIGWDVGGWLGAKNAIAVASWSAEEGIAWAAVGSNRLPEKPGPLPELVEALAGTHASAVVLDALERDLRIVVAVDAPLGVPDAFRRFLADPEFVVTRPSRHIDHPLSFRETDRQIAALMDKVPLSATFDSLANPASVAVAFTRRWTAQGFRLTTGRDDAPAKAIIEVYPALSKQDFAVLGTAVEAYAAPLLPSGVSAGTDKYDAALCALLALGFAGCPSLPRLVPAPGSPSEGAIWYPAEAPWRGTRIRKQPPAVVN